jgi:hypothetical protein
MSVLLYTKWALPKSGDPRMQSYGTRVKETMELTQKWTEEGIYSSPPTSWADNTGVVIGLYIFSSMNALAKLWGKEEYHKAMTQIFTCVDDPEIKIMRLAGFEPGSMKVIRDIV